MKKSGFSVTIACYTTSIEDWFNSRNPLHILPDFPHKEANKFRKKYLKGFIKPEGCNYYIGLSYSNLLIGILGFANPDYGNYDLLLKADTTPPDLEYSTDLLLYILLTKEVKYYLKRKFNREINTVYSLAFSKHKDINRYRKHGQMTKREKDGNVYKIGYLFKTGKYTLREAKSLFVQKHGY